MAVFWTYAVVWIFSALIHMADSGVGGAGGLGKASVLFSVSILALLFTAPVWLAVAVYWRKGWKLFLVTVAVLAAGQGTLVAGLSSQAKETGPTAVGLIGLFGLAILIAASVPVLFKGLPKKAESSPS